MQSTVSHTQYWGVSRNLKLITVQLNISSHNLHENMFAMLEICQALSNYRITAVTNILNIPKKSS